MVNFVVDKSFRMPGPINPEMAELGFPGFTTTPNQWGSEMVRGMKKAIRAFDQRLEKCVRDLSSS